MATKRRAEITDESIAALPYARADKRYSVTDPDCRGLVIRVAKSTRSFHLQMRDALGRPRRWHIADCHDMTLEAARAKVGEWRGLVKRGLDPQKEERAREQARQENTFAKAAESFVLRHLRPKNRTWEQAARQLGLAVDRTASNGGGKPKFDRLEGSLVDRWGDRKVDEITRAEVAAVLDGYVDRDAPIMANRVFATLRKFFNWAVGRGLIEASPVTGMSPPSEERDRDRVLDDDELLAVWKASDNLGPRMGPVTKLLILTGQRRAEVSGMRWSELDLNAGVWTIPKDRAKNVTEHTVPLSPQALRIIEQIRPTKGCDYLFTRNTKTPVSGFSKVKREMDDAARIPEWRLHDLRRTAASGMARLGVPVATVEKVLNHVSGTFKGIVKVYQRHDFAKEKRAALDAWGRHVESLIEGNSSNVISISSRAVAQP